MASKSTTTRTRKATPQAPKPTVGKSRYALGQVRSPAEWEALVLKVYVPHLQGGGTMQALREQYGRSQPARDAMLRLGLGTPADITAGRTGNIAAIKVKGVRPAMLAKRIAEARAAGTSFPHLVHMTGLAKDELTALLKAHGHTDVAVGRVVTTERGKARLAAKLAAEAAAAKPVRKPRTRKAKVTA